jgi:radical SAM protein with 4Fe4S-binding SPASM domain
LTENNRKVKEDNLSLELLVKAVTSETFARAEKTVILLQGGEPTLVGEAPMTVYIRTILKALPEAKIVVISNMFSLPDWFARLSHQYLDSRIETTFALGGKATLSGDESGYLERFSKALNKASDLGIHVAINIELNRETVAAGAESLVKYLMATRSKFWEIDLSVDFDTFLKSPKYNKYSYPELPLSVDYRQVSMFLAEFSSLYYRVAKGSGVYCGTVESVSASQMTNAFNVRQEGDFVTLNPDGSVTTNPLFSDLTETYLGNLNNDSLDSIIQSVNRSKRMAWEVKRAMPCLSCTYFSSCSGGASHVPLRDGSGECAGLMMFRDKFNSVA